MKKTFLTLAVIAIAQFSYAQFSTSGDNTTTSDNVGIGTTSPSAKLQVNYLYTDAAGISLYGGPSSGTALSVGGSAGDGGGSVINIAPGWNTNASPYALDISPTGVANGTDTRLLNISFASSNKMVVIKNGNVGIGITSPGSKLEVNGNGYFAGDLNINGISSSTNSIGLSVSGGTPALTLRGSTASNTMGGSASLFFLDNTNVNDWALQVDGSYNFGFWKYSAGWSKVAGITQTGGAFFGDNVSIGTTNSQGYKLAVNGSAIATSMTVKLYTDWPDYVFKPKYKLTPLKEIKTYIDKNQRLPDMPSEQEVKDNGINLGEIVKVQTKKIEELTLYAIEQKEEIEQLKKGQEALKSALAKLTASNISK